MQDSAPLEFFAPCARGTEGFLAEELWGMGIRKVRPLNSGAAFYGTMDDAYKALLWSRVASRVLLRLARFEAQDADALYEGCRNIPWEDHISPQGTIAIAAHGTNQNLRNTQFTAQRAKDALCDRLREHCGARPSVNAAAPDVQVSISLRDTKATVSIDLAGDPLFKRGYRAGNDQGKAPLKETLAAAVLYAGGWPKVSQAGGILVDPLCGSGTIAIEAGLMAADVAPGIFRERWGFEGWLGNDQDAWDALLDEADERASVGLAVLGSEQRIFASDIDKHMVQIALANAKRAGLGMAIDFCAQDVAKLYLPAYCNSYQSCAGLLATNPPYGERLSSLPELPALYEALGGFISRTPALGSASIITTDQRIDGAVIAALQGDKINLRPSVIKTNNGPLEATIRTYCL